MKTNHTLQLATVLILGTMLASACTYSYSQAPVGTPTAIPTGLFVSPFPSGQDPLKIIAALGTETAAAATTTAGGPTTVSGTAGTPSTQAVATDTPGAGTEVATLLPVTVEPNGSTPTPTTQVSSTIVVPTISGTVSVPTTSGTVGPVPSSYTLQKGEWPYCIARRFNVNPQELLTLNNLTVDESFTLMPGLVLSIPQTGDPFPADRALHTHPDTWTVEAGDTLNSIACFYGDLTPDQIATANNLSSSAILTTGTKLTIP
jgi:LysM repeat protein